MSYIRETIETEIKKQCDVLVAGGGVAGIASALAAARNGAKVLLIEREYMLGGLATAGLVTIYLPLCDGMGRQVSFGIAEELLRLSITDNCIEDKNPIHWLSEYDAKTRAESERFEVQFNAQMFAISAERLLKQNGVEILYGTVCCAADVTDSKITAVMCENKSGRFAISVKSVVDCTGDADCCRAAGADTALFGAGNVLAAWHYSYSDSEKYRLRMRGAADIPDSVKGQVNYEDKLSDRRFSGIDGDELSEQVQMAHEIIFNDVMKKRKTDKSYVPVTIATIPQVRMTRRICGVSTLDISEMHTRFNDSIGMVSDWRRRGPVWEVPFGTLYGGKIRNLITAGRCTSVTDDMWDVMRVIPCCAVTGQAAGTAAAMTDDFASLDVSELQSRLVSGGVVLHESELD